ncbi:PucR family transcriptional regulator ligand-binding domain-containing protein [Clostridiaceae bacterium 35-E11]
MGVTVKQILEDKFFKKCEVLAGQRGLCRKVQAVALFDAPDGYKWLKGKEFIVTTGYLFQENEGLFEDVIRHIYQHNGGALGIKIDRFLKKIPNRIIDLCNELKIPLISLPNDAPWIHIINAVNAVAINKYILQIHNGMKNIVDLQYTEKKIQKIVRDLSKEIEKPVVIYDLLNNKVYPMPDQSCEEFVKFSCTELWEPSISYQKEVICDKLKIYRITNLDEEGHKSWIMIPIYIKDMMVAYFVVWEPEEKIDYYDLFAIRLSLTLLIYLYEQIYLMHSIEGKFQDDFIQELIQEDKKDKEMIYRKAHKLGINIEQRYVCICIYQDNKRLCLYQLREKIFHRIYQMFPKDKTLFGLLDENTVMILYGMEESFSTKQMQELKNKCSGFIEALENDIVDSNFRGGIGHTVAHMIAIKESYIESVKAIEIGKYFYPDEKIVLYKDLGPFGLFRVEAFQQEDVHGMIEDILPVLQQEDKTILIETLRIYLESESNYNVAAKKLFIHSNTVRYRIDKIQQLCNIDLRNPMERLKLQIMLRFINVLDT